MTASLLTASDLQVRFGGVVAVRNLTLHVDAGELLCIIGPNGAGKSTLLNLLTGILRPTAGAISFAGHNLVGRALHEFAHLGIVRKFQIPAVFGAMTVRANLEVAREVQRSPSKHSLIDDVLDLIGLKNQAQQMAGHLAHGDIQKLEIGICLMCRPKLLLLDEPTAGMTSDETTRTAELLRTLQDDHTIIVIEHDMRFVRALATRTCVMHQGAIIRDASFHDIESDAEVRDIYLGKQ